MNIVITGCFNNQAYGHHGRDEVKRIIKSAGHNNRSEVTSKTDYLVAGYDPGPSKIAIAKKLGIPTITLPELQQIIAP